MSFSEHDHVEVYDTSDPDWTLVKFQNEYGFAPANYIEAADDEDDTASPPAMPARPRAPIVAPEPEPQEEEEAPHNPAAALAGVLQQRTGASAVPSRHVQYTPEASDEDAASPPLPQRPRAEQLSPPPTQVASPSPQSSESLGLHASKSRGRGQSLGAEAPTSPSGYHMYNIHEMISHMGKNKKMPTTLGVNVSKGTILIAPEKSSQQEWTAEKLTHYSIEGKHVFVELVRPSKSIDFHAGAKDTAHEITSALGELAGAARAEGLKEVFAAGSGKSGQKKGHMLYEFMAQGDDEVTVAENDEVLVLDDTKSDDWWMVRRLKNGKEGVVPRQYVEVTGVIEAPQDLGLAQARSTVEQNRLDEERLTREALEASERDRRKSRRQSKKDSESRPKPNSSNVRTWTDRSGSFKVDAEFLGIKDGKIHIHKVNGVKIAVAANRMAVEDLEYVERMTGQSLEDEKPLSAAIDKRRSKQNREKQTTSRSQSGAAFQPPESKYDWFDFFLQCGVNPQICERYAHAFQRDQMDEENLVDIQPTVLRTLGLKEGDILRVMKHLDDKFGRQRKIDGEATDGANADGIFSGPGGTLRNNTRKGRPAPAVTNNDTVDPRAFEQNAIKKDNTPDTPTVATPSSASRTSSMPQKSKASGFDDDAWDVKPSKELPPVPKESPPPARTQMAAPAPQKPMPTGAMAELSLLSPPLQPQQTAPQASPQQPQPPPTQQPVPQQPPQPPGADRSFFDQLGSSQGLPQPPNQAQQLSIARQRPLPPQQTGQNQNSFLPALPSNRSASAPQNQQPSAFGPPLLQPQMTGYQGQPALPGQSLNDLSNQRIQQQYTQPQQMPPMQTQPTGFGFGAPPQPQFQQQQMQAQPTGFYPQQPQQFQPQPTQQFQQPQPTQRFQQPQPTQQFQQPQQPQHFQQPQHVFLNGQQTGSPFADPPRAPFQPQPTGFQPSYPQQPMQPQQTGVNSVLPAPLQPQPTGAGFGGFGPQPNGFAQQQPPPPVPPLPPMPQQQAAPLQAQKTGPAPPVSFGLKPQPTGKASLAHASEFIVLMFSLNDY